MAAEVLTPAGELRSRVEAALRRGVASLAGRQTAQGSWCGDYGGPLFLLPMYLILQHIVGRPIPGPRRSRMIDHLLGAQNPDGSFGLHVEGEGSAFTSVLGYVGLRLLGCPPDEPALDRLRSWIRGHGTPLGTAQWGKLFLALLDLYDWRGLYPIPPELWLLPYAVPFHPGRWWCHARQVYLPMSWLYGHRARLPADRLACALREELYDRPYREIDFARHRRTLSPADAFRPATPLLAAANRLLLAHERLCPPGLRRRALAAVERELDYEDRVTSGIRLGPVNAVLNTLCQHFRSPGSEALRRGLDQVDVYLWDGHDGVKMNGYNSTELWDTALAVQAILATPLADEHAAVLVRAHGFLRDNQLLEDPPAAAAHYRHAARGGWPFSNRPHGWPVSDCTAEGLKAALALAARVPDPLPAARLEAAVELILSWQDEDGGWASYERRRGGAWLEGLNPSQVFADIMVERSYPECTSSCVQALVRARPGLPRLAPAIDRAVRRGAAFLRRTQRGDGSWEGSWGICFSYGTWFGISGLTAAGATPQDPAILRAVDFLLAHQRQDGAWGEHARGCRERRWVEHPESQVVMTSWALAALCRARCRAAEPLRRAVSFLLARQAADGGWPRQALAGMFNRTCAIDFDNYRRYFPVWALGEWLALGDDK